MKYINLGNTDVQVSVFPLGAMTFGTGLDRDAVFALLDAYVEHGGNFIDTANMYAFWLSEDPEDNGGESETVIGEWLADRGGRDDLVITTKVGNVTSHRMIREQGPCLRADYIVEQCDLSLRRLGIEQIDLYYAHTDDRSTPVEEVMEAFARLREQGKIRHIGASNWRSWRLEQARHVCEEHGFPFFVCTQQKHSYYQAYYGAPELWEQPYANHSFQDYCRTYGLTMFGWEPLLGGMYLPDRPLGTRKYDYRTPNNVRRRRALSQLAEETGATPFQIVLAWMTYADPPIYPVVAADTPAQLVEDLAAADLEFTAEQMERLNHAPWEGA